MTAIDQPVRTLEGPEYIEVDGVMIPNYDETIPLFSEGDVVNGRVVKIDKDEVLVDIGFKSEGVIPLSELSIRKNVNVHDEVELGEMVDALVMQKEDQDGRLILSKKRARFEKAWKRIEAAAAAGEMVEGTVIEVVKGGLIIDLGVRGFLPASLVDIRRVQDLDEFMGKQLECKVIELNRSRNNVVLSRRAVIEDERREVRQKILDDLQPGQVVEGVISNIVDFGAFVDLEGIDGLIHISELSWSHVNHPSEVLNIGDTVNVKVLDIDRDRQRISLGLKQTQSDPWQSVIDTYEVGSLVQGKVTKVVTFGAFVEIHPGVEGLVHISELAAHHVENPREVVSQGDDLTVRVIEIDGERRRLSLSLKRVSDTEQTGVATGTAGIDYGEGDGEGEDGEYATSEGEAPAGEPEAPADDQPAEESAEGASEAEAPVEEAPAEDAVTEEPVAEEPVAEEPVAEEPVAEEAVADEVAVEEPVADESAEESSGGNETS
jgi:small subunit ribosomal protein S1